MKPGKLENGALCTHTCVLYLGSQAVLTWCQTGRRVSSKHMLDPAYVEPAARGISKRCQCISGTAGATQASNYGMTQTQHSVGSQPALISSYAAQQHCQDGRSIKLRDARGVYFEPETSYINHYPEKVPEASPSTTSLTGACFVRAPACNFLVSDHAHKTPLHV